MMIFNLFLVVLMIKVAPKPVIWLTPLGDEIDLEMLSQEVPVTTDLLETEDHAPIVRLINALLSQAVREGASDIHLEAF